MKFIMFLNEMESFSKSVPYLNKLRYVIVLLAMLLLIHSCLLKDSYGIEIFDTFHATVH